MAARAAISHEIPSVKPEPKLVVFTGDLSHSVIKGIIEIDRVLPQARWLVLQHSPRRSAGTLLRNQWRNLQRNGWRWIPYQAGEILGKLVPRRQTAPARRAPGQDFDLKSFAARPDVEVRRVDNVHDESSLEIVRAFDPDLGLSLAAPILREPLFSIPRLGTINLHKGKVPQYRGMPPAFWELWTDASEVGCTVHRVDKSLDTGDILRTARIPVSRFSTLRGLQLTLDELGITLMRDSVTDLLSGRAVFQPQSGEGKTYRKPTLRQVAELKAKVARRQPSQAMGPVRLIKSARTQVAQAAWRAGLWRALTPRITVLLYHRVSDEVRDNLTVGIEQFDRQMALLRRHCNVLSIEEVVAPGQIAPSSRPTVAVTFDDGYLDNYTLAAPILLRHRIPAAFFVSTEIVNSDRRFPHDVRRGNAAIPVMTWDNMRDMLRWGLSIGSHSQTHIDCAKEPEVVVMSELTNSRETLQRELGIRNPIFAYPYGGRQHMTPARLERVKEAGYPACLSAYGGSNIGQVDPYNVLRTGINWEFSDKAFLYHCMGLR